MIKSVEYFKGLMEVSKDTRGDYYINILREGAEKIKNPVNSSYLDYNWLEAEVLSQNKKMGEYVSMTCSNDSSVAFSPGEVTLDREDSTRPYDSIVRVFPLALDSLINKEKEFLMTRYDRENKLWIYLKDDPL